MCNKVITKSKWSLVHHLHFIKIEIKNQDEQQSHHKVKMVSGASLALHKKKNNNNNQDALHEVISHSFSSLTLDLTSLSVLASSKESSVMAFALTSLSVLASSKESSVMLAYSVLYSFSAFITFCSS